MFDVVGWRILSSFPTEILNLMKLFSGERSPGPRGSRHQRLDRHYRCVHGFFQRRHIFFDPLINLRRRNLRMKFTFLTSVSRHSTLRGDEFPRKLFGNRNENYRFAFEYFVQSDFGPFFDLLNGFEHNFLPSQRLDESPRRRGVLVHRELGHPSAIGDPEPG